MTYEEKYSETIYPSDLAQEQEEQRIKNEEKLEKYEKCIETIKDLLPKENEKLTYDDLVGLVEEIDFMIRSVENAC